MCFWASLADFLVAVAPVGTALAALAAAVAAWKALSAWRDEMLGKRKAELAEDALTKFYQAERAISIIRSPIVGTSESEGREREPDETEKRAKFLIRITFPSAASKVRTSCSPIFTRGKPTARGAPDITDSLICAV
jgi:hypothetical protein